MFSQLRVPTAWYITNNISLALQLRSAERQTLHLVLRDLYDVRPASTQPIPPVAAVNTPQPPTSAQAPAGGGPHTQPLPQQAPIAHAQHFFPGAAQPLMHAAIPPPNAPFGMVPPAAMGALGAPTMPFGSHNQRAVATHHVVAQAHAAQAQAQRQWAATMNAHMGPHAGAPNAVNVANMDQQLLQELINRNQRERASAGRNGAQDSQHAPNLRPPAGGNIPGQSASPFQPDGTRSVVREGVGPNGQQWRITFNESITAPQGFQRNPRTGSPFAMADVQNIWRPPSGASHPRSAPQGSQPGNLSAFDVQQMLRTADAGQAATRAMTDAMRRNASTSSLASLANSQSNQPIPPGVTTPLIPSRGGSAAGTPDPTRAGGRASNPPTSHPLSQPASSTPEVFILSSPEGPRALLVNGGLGAYYTSPMPTVAFGQRPLGQHPLAQIPVPNLGPYFPQMPPRPAGNIWAPTPAENAALQLRNQQQQEAHAPAPPPAQALPQQAAVHHHHHPHPMVHQNVHIRAVALGQIWPHIWMVFRLMLFIWWFTSPSSSWTRWFTVISIAIALFLFNTGLLNPLADQVRIPVRRHLENLMPAADNHGRRRPERFNHDQSTGADGMPQPADTATRLVEERRRANANWLLTQARRLERAGILFLASIAPGVAERHIANVEAEARAERERQEAREAEAAAASAAAAAEAEGSAAAPAAAENAEASGDANAAPGGEGSASGTSPGDLPGAASSGDGNTPRAQNPAQEPLVAI